MTCPQCTYEKNLVIRTETGADTVTRQRQCCSCGWRWDTVEAKSNEFRALQALHERVKGMVKDLPSLGLSE